MEEDGAKQFAMHSCTTLREQNIDDALHEVGLHAAVGGYDSQSKGLLLCDNDRFFLRQHVISGSAFVLAPLICVLSHGPTVMVLKCAL